MKAYIALTFDYELFLGRNLGSGDEVLFGPTEQLLATLARVGAPATFFADVCSLGAHERAGDSEYPRLFSAQLRAAAALGHDVQLHVHPHWEYATRRDHRWWPTPGRMNLCDFIDDQARPLDKILRDGIDYLVQLIRPIMPKYRCVAFRGPGLALQPREEAVLAALQNAGIELDSTVAKDYTLDGGYVTVDYRHCPSEPNWRMTPRWGIRHAALGDEGIWEVPIISFVPSFSDRGRFLARRVRLRNQLRGYSLTTTGSNNSLRNIAHLIGSNVRYVSPRTRFLVSPDSKGLTVPMLVDGLAQYLRRHSQHDVICASVIGHPKLLFTEQLAMLDEFIQRSRAELGVHFVTLTDTLKALSLMAR